MPETQDSGTTEVSSADERKPKAYGARGVLVLGPGDTRCSGVLFPSCAAAEAALESADPITWSSTQTRAPTRTLPTHRVDVCGTTTSVVLQPLGSGGSWTECVSFSERFQSFGKDLLSEHQVKPVADCLVNPVFPSSSIPCPILSASEHPGGQSSVPLSTSRASPNATSTAAVDGSPRVEAVVEMPWVGEGAWVLTSGTALGPSLLRRLSPSALTPGRLLLPSSTRRPHPPFKLLCDRLQRSCSTELCSSCGERHEVERTITTGAIQVSAVLAAVWRCPLIANAVETLLREWTFPGQDSEQMPEHSCQEDIANALPQVTLPLFVVLRVGPAGRIHSSQQLIEGTSAALSELLHRLQLYGVGGEALTGGGGAGWWRGRRLLLEASPFGSGVFLNAWSEGVAAGAAGPRSCLLLADARAAPGCEGAPAFLPCTLTDGRVAPRRRIGPVALTVAPVSWWRGEWVGFTLLAALSPVLRAVVPARPAPTPLSAAVEMFSLLEAGDGGSVVAASAAAEAGLVLVRCATEWGSGVVISLPPGDAPAPAAAAARAPVAHQPRIVLTCAHVVRHSPDPQDDEAGAWGRVAVWWRGRRFRCRLLFRAPPAVAFDVAVLELLVDPALPAPTPLPLAPVRPFRGERVVCAGFPLLADGCGGAGGGAGRGPLVSVGCVARSSPALLQAACVAQSGASGGALLRLTNDKSASPLGVEVVGLVVSNVRDGTNGALFPHFCMAAPAASLLPPLHAYQRTRNTAALRGLTPDDTAIQRIWLLQEPPLLTAAPPNPHL